MTDALHLAHAGGESSRSFLTLVAMWLAMMAVMMAPAVWPWVHAFRRFDLTQKRGAAVVASGMFVSGYLVAWLVYAFGAAALQMALTRQGALDPVRGMSSSMAAGILVGAGLFQFAPFKRACLTHCRNPFTYFLSRWRNGPTNGLRIGFNHGLFCVGCCWALMLTALAVGMMNLWWMIALSVAAFVEQVAPRGQQIRAGLGVALVLAGVARL